MPSTMASRFITLNVLKLRSIAKLFRTRLGDPHRAEGLFIHLKSGFNRANPGDSVEFEFERLAIFDEICLVHHTNFIETIAKGVQTGIIDGVSDLRDESDREGMRIVIDL